MNEAIVTYINGKPIYRRTVGILPANKALSGRAKALRKAGVLSEVIFWLQVKKGGFYGIDFDRQRVIGNFIVDFYVKSLGLVIEIDGSSHDHKQAYDAMRETYLTHLGLHVFRVSDYRVKNDLAHVMQELAHFICCTFTKPSYE